MCFQTEILDSIPVDELTGAIAVPIYQTSTYVQSAPGEHKGFDYSRSNNPTRQAVEGLIAKLENGVAGFAFASGLAAIDAVLKLFSAGDEILAVDDIYGGTYRLLTHVYSRLGVKTNWVDTSDLEAVEKALHPGVKCIWVESPTNPTLKTSDLQALAELAHSVGALLVVDNTFATPVLQKPIDSGADIVIHSATKYLGGHSDLIAGLAVAATPELAEQLKFIQNASGGVLAPFDSFLLIRGIETLDLRVKRIVDTAAKLVQHLEVHPAIADVHYPGFGGVISFSLKEDTIDAAVKVVISTKSFHLAESLGGVKSLICHPASMTHASVPEVKRLQSGIRDSLIRLSVGIESVESLWSDLEGALS